MSTQQTALSRQHSAVRPNPKPLKRRGTEEGEELEKATQQSAVSIQPRNGLKKDKETTVETAIRRSKRGKDETRIIGASHNAPKSHKILRFLRPSAFQSFCSVFPTDSGLNADG